MKAAGVKLDLVLEIDVPDSAIIDRMSGRRVHAASGRTYHVHNNPPKVEGQDDVTGEPLTQRPDDAEDIVRKRLATYHEQTEPLVAYYAQWAATGDAAGAALPQDQRHRQRRRHHAARARRPGELRRRSAVRSSPRRRRRGLCSAAGSAHAATGLCLAPLSGDN